MHEPGRLAVRLIAVLTALAGVLQLITQIPGVHSRLGGSELEFGPLDLPVVHTFVRVEDHLRSRCRLVGTMVMIG